MFLPLKTASPVRLPSSNVEAPVTPKVPPTVALLVVDSVVVVIRPSLVMPSVVVAPSTSNVPPQRAGSPPCQGALEGGVACHSQRATDSGVVGHRSASQGHRTSVGHRSAAGCRTTAQCPGGVACHSQRATDSGAVGHRNASQGRRTTAQGALEGVTCHSQRATDSGAVGHRSASGVAAPLLKVPLRVVLPVTPNVPPTVALVAERGGASFQCETTGGGWHQPPNVPHQRCQGRHTTTQCPGGVTCHSQRATDSGAVGHRNASQGRRTTAQGALEGGVALLPTCHRQWRWRRGWYCLSLPTCHRRWRRWSPQR